MESTKEKEAQDLTGLYDLAIPLSMPISVIRELVENFDLDLVKQRTKSGDRRILYVDGLKMLGPDQADGLVDGIHCNSLGFYFNAQGLEPYLRKAVKWAQP